MTRAATFKLSDVQRAVKAVQALGLPITAVEIAPDGTIRVLTGMASMSDQEDPAVVEWERKHGLRPDPQPSPYDQWRLDERLAKSMPEGSRARPTKRRD